MSWDIEQHADHDHVAIVTMTTNPVNAQNPDFFEDLHECFDRLERSFADCAVVLTGQGSTFSAGLDFEHHFPLFASGDRDAIDEWFDTFQSTNLRLFTYPRPTVAALNGHAFAGGLLTALSCDYRVAVDEEASFGLNEIDIGVPFPATFVEILRYSTGTASIGPATLFAHVCSPREALEVGFVHEIVPAEKVISTAAEVAASVHPDCYDTYAYTKRAFQQHALDVIERCSEPQDREEFAAAVSTPGSVQAHARRYREIRDTEPHWEV